MSKHLCTPVQSDVSVKSRKRPHVALQQQQHQEEEESLVENFLCPISLGLPADPVVGKTSPFMSMFFTHCRRKRWTIVRAQRDFALAFSERHISGHAGSDGCRVVGLLSSRAKRDRGTRVERCRQA